MRRLVVLVAVVGLLAGAGCGDDGDEGAKGGTANEVTTTTAPVPAIKVTARDYAFDVPATISAGLVAMTLDNAGKEPHFAALAQPREGVPIADVQAAVTAIASGKPPAGGPPPFVEYIARILNRRIGRAAS